MRVFRGRTAARHALAHTRVSEPIAIGRRRVWCKALLCGLVIICDRRYSYLLVASTRSFGFPSIQGDSHSVQLRSESGYFC